MPARSPSLLPASPSEAPFICAVLPRMPSGVAIWRGIQRYMKETGRTWNLSHPPTDTPLTRRLRTRPDLRGLIVFAATKELHQAAVSLKVPAINVSGKLRESQLPRVRIDEIETGRLAARHLVDAGYDRILSCLEPKAHDFDRLRLEGLRKEWKAHDRKNPPIEHPPVLEPVLRELENSKLSTGIVVSNFNFASTLMDKLREMPDPIRRETGLISLDDPTGAFFWSQEEPVSFIKLPWEQVGYVAAGCLDTWLENGAPPPLGKVLRGHSIVAMESTRRLHRLPLIARSVVEWLDNRYDPRMGVNEIASALGFSVSGLYKNYRAAFGHTLSEELKRRRHLHAKQLLAESHLPVKAIAEECGYNGASAFIQAFRKTEGRTPVQWRREG